MSAGDKAANSDSIDQFVGWRVFVLVNAGGIYLITGVLRSKAGRWLYLDDTNLPGVSSCKTAFQLSQVTAIWRQGAGI